MNHNVKITSTRRTISTVYFESNVVNSRLMFNISVLYFEAFFFLWISSGWWRLNSSKHWRNICNTHKLLHYNCRKFSWFTNSINTGRNEHVTEWTVNAPCPSIITLAPPTPHQSHRLRPPPARGEDFSLSFHGLHHRKLFEIWRWCSNRSSTSALYASPVRQETCDASCHFLDSSNTLNCELENTVENVLYSQKLF